MKKPKKIKTPFFFALGLVPPAAAAGIFTGLYQKDVLPPEMMEMVFSQTGGEGMYILLFAVQTVVYAVFCGFLGCLLAEKIGLWKRIRFEKEKTLKTLAISLVGGVIFSLDHWVFGGMLEGIREANVQSLSVQGVLAGVLYGGIVEEVMMRLFVMSLLALIIRKAFFGKCSREKIPEAVYLAANFIAAILFAAGHLPATRMLFGRLTPLILLRCFLLNGGFGLVFGALYRRYGIHYAMAGHALFHVTAKGIWWIFI